MEFGHNPGPPIRHHTLNFGYLNINSAKKISRHSFTTSSTYFSTDIVALSETRFHEDTPDAVKNDLTAAGYCVTHVHRQAIANHPSGGGLAVAFCNDVAVKSHPLSTSLCPDRFELQLLRITSIKPAVAVVNVYRPPVAVISASSMMSLRTCLR